MAPDHREYTNLLMGELHGIELSENIEKVNGWFRKVVDEITGKLAMYQDVEKRQGRKQQIEFLRGILQPRVERGWRPLYYCVSHDTEGGLVLKILSQVRVSEMYMRFIDLNILAQSGYIVEAPVEPLDRVERLEEGGILFLVNRDLNTERLPDPLLPGDNLHFLTQIVSKPEDGTFRAIEVLLDKQEKLKGTK